MLMILFLVLLTNLVVKSEDFVSMMEKEFEMSMKEELTFFLGLQIKQTNVVIFISQTKYAIIHKKLAWTLLRRVLLL